MTYNQAQQICLRLKLHPAQKKMCLSSLGISSTLLDSVRLSVVECQANFKFDRWNCSLGKPRINMLNKGYKETAYLHALTSSSLVHTFSRACAQGRLDRCTCDESFSASKNKEAWLWGGCGDNIQYGMKFARRFLRWMRKSLDLQATADSHNSDVGIRVVRNGINKTCKCHGVSGSCTVQTCWRQLANFHEVGSDLKSKYDSAVKVVVSANQSTGKGQLTKRRKNSVQSNPKKGDLVFLEKSPNYCEPTAFGHGTTGRVCDLNKNCDILCCGRGYNIHTRIVDKPCHCQVIWCCHVKCQRCSVREDIYTCK
ncbi:hypothetical protein CAPTEDRAFT_222661 [Capitella teleta]|uniref:Protein Wnt n=1 Tax=Capitella teleta TaxID=283909 RepID=R7TWL1_CAPTE|nr:hypothetical protein CAPTEDRAFT_222661 [Capitella teleta]|eukprot:ELT95360.1 hypothetical protein CAPTEDRAFT_222661 [Capitella teleta]